MLIPLKEAEYHNKRFEKDFEYGPRVKEDFLETKKVAEFNTRYEKIIPHVNELKAIAQNKTLEKITKIFSILGTAKQSVLKLTQNAAKKNKPLKPIHEELEEIVKIVSRKKLTAAQKDEAKTRAELLIGYCEGVEKKLKTNGLKEKAQYLVETIKQKELEDTKETAEQLIKMIDNRKVKNKDLELIVKKMHKELYDIFFVLDHQFDYNTKIVEDQPSLPDEVMKKVSESITATRGITVFEYGMKDGRNLVQLKNNIKTKNEVIAYGTDRDIDLCTKARENGVDHIAKRGINMMTHHRMDITINLLDQFDFFKQKEDGYSLLYTTPEEKKFHFIFKRSVPKKNGIVIFNIPYYKLHVFQGKISKEFTILGMYRVDDVMKNILFICQYKEDKGQDPLLFTRGMLNYNGLTHYSEMQEIFINKGSFDLPKYFRPEFVDMEDIQNDFKNFPSSIDEIEEYYAPKEKIIELNRPLEEIKEGHYPAVATTEIINGIYETEGFSNLYSSKVTREEIVEETEEMFKGKKVRMISAKNKNIIEAIALLPNGEYVDLLNPTGNNSKQGV